MGGKVIDVRSTDFRLFPREIFLESPGVIRLRLAPDAADTLGPQHQFEVNVHKSHKPSNLKHVFCQ